MGGLGSGPYGYGSKRAKAPTGACLSLDIRKLRRDKLLSAGMSYGWSWTTSRRGVVDKDRESSIRIKVISSDEIQLSCMSTSNDVATPIKQSVMLGFSSCHYGGQRVWFRCPRCDKRVALLYLKGVAFRCRLCHDLTYYSCQESGDNVEEALRTANALLVKLKHEKQYGMDIMRCHPYIKPKGMHWSTFSRLYSEFNKAQSEYISALNTTFAGPIGALKRRTIG